MDDYEARDLDRRIAHADDMQMREKQEAYEQIRTLRTRLATYEAALREIATKQWTDLTEVQAIARKALETP